MIKREQLDLFAHALLTGSLDVAPLKVSRTELLKAVAPIIELYNYRLGNTDRQLASKWSLRAEDNIRAIELADQILRERRPATPDEQARLMLFTGFGASKLANSLFPLPGKPYPDGWAGLGERLKAAVPNRAEFDSLMRATQFAHYTPEFMIRELWRAVQSLGFQGGDILEPGCGTGLMLALAPDAIAATSRFTGYENDPISARIARLLHPKAEINTCDFLGPVGLNVGRYDLAIGNPPFANLPIRNVAPVTLSLHEAFIFRALRNLKPDALAAFVVSRYLMDSSGTTAREAIGGMAQLVGAIRMPERSMQISSGTAVVVDLVVLRRRGGKEAADLPWIETAGVDAKGGKVAVNRYFADHPEMVLGRHALTSSQWRAADYTCLPFEDGPPLATRLAVAINALATRKSTQNITQIIHDERESVTVTPEPIENTASNEAAKLYTPEPERVEVRSVAEGGTVREGSYVIDSRDCLCRIKRGEAIPVEIRSGHASTGIPRKHAAIIRDMIPIRDAARAILRAQASDEPWSGHVSKLRIAYDRFVSARDPDGPGGKRGPINYTKHGTRMVNRIITTVDDETGEETVTKEKYPKATYSYPNIKPFDTDPDVRLVTSIERHDLDTNEATPGPIFTHRLEKPDHTPPVETAGDAMAVCLNHKGGVRIGYIQSLMKLATEDETIAALGDLVYLNPETGQWEQSEEYLSGAVRRKLAVAQAMAATDPQYRRNVEALEVNQPTDLLPSEITARLGAPWIGQEHVVSFANKVLGMKMSLIHNADSGSWELSIATKPDPKWGTMRRGAGQLLSDALNSKSPKIYDTILSMDGKERRELNSIETEAAREKLERIKQAFETWIWTDQNRSDELVLTYNARMNDIKGRSYNGAHLTLPGSSLLVTPHPHQKSLVWRAITSGSTYAAHVVGSGKTMACAAAVMDQRRLKLIKKAIVTVPSHTLGQWHKDWMVFYPGARILVADEANFKDKDDRHEFLSRAATEEWDAIITTHEAFKMIPAPAAFEATFVQKLIDQYEEALTKVEEGDKLSRKRLERLKQGQENKLVALRARKDDLLTIEELGVDYIVVDEAQQHRKLGFATNMIGLLGIDPNGSQRAWDLFVKVRWIDSRKPGRAVLMASGTPITNTMGELYSLIKFIDPDTLEERGIQQFDSFSATFCDTTTNLELGPNGKFKPVTRFAKFVNVPEMVGMFRQGVDIVTNDQIRHLVKLPRIVTGKRQLITADPSDLFKAYQKTLDRRIEIIKKRKGPPRKGDDILLSVITDGRHAALDVRLAVRSAENEPENKLNKLVENAYRIWQETSDREYMNPATGLPYPRKGAAQMIFSDLGTPSIEARRGFSAYTWIKSELIRKGVPEEEIAIIHDFPNSMDKIRLFLRMNAGAVRFLIGSSEKMGTGVNAQLRLYALHHLDVPWYPMLIGQREGRIVRQGNQNEEILIFAYATLTSMDAPMWGTNERKQGFIDAALSGDRSIRVLQDVSDVDQFAMAKALASGDDRLMQQAGLSAEVARLRRLERARQDEQYQIRGVLTSAERNIERCARIIPLIKQDIAARQPASPFTIMIGDTEWTDRKDGGTQLSRALIRYHVEQQITPKIVAHYRGFPIEIAGRKTTFNDEAAYDSTATIILSGDRDREIAWEITSAWHVLMDRIDKQIDLFDYNLMMEERTAESARNSIKDYANRTSDAFDMQEELDSKVAALDKVNDDLATDATVDQGRRAA